MLYTLIVRTRDKSLTLGEIDLAKEKTTLDADGFLAEVEVKNIGEITRCDIKLSGSEPSYASIRMCYDEGEIYTYSGKRCECETFRQSPHNPNNHAFAEMPKEAVPMVAVNNGGIYTILFSDNPATCNNYTTQTVNPDEKYAEVSSGDSGIKNCNCIECKPYFQGKKNNFTVFIAKFEAASLPEFRRKVLFAVNAAFGGVTSKFGALGFASNYMHYRVNETGVSRGWVVAGIDYCNKQYTRDAFWQSMVLPEYMQRECYEALDFGRVSYAENPLLYILWSYRNTRCGGGYNAERLDKAIEYVKAHTENGFYITGTDTRLAFRSWYDICSFENDDCIAYNQGLFAAALIALDEMGISHEWCETEAAIFAYSSLFLADKGYIPLSRKKPQVLSVDPLVGDLLSFVLFGRTVLPDEIVLKHYETVFSAGKTKYGTKVTCLSGGGYLTLFDYSAYESVHYAMPSFKNGNYALGGSYFIYEMLFHMAALVHGAPDALDNMIWRTKIDLNIGGTTFENIDTVTGKGNKPNQGWNAAIYPLSKILDERGVITERFINEIDKLL